MVREHVHKRDFRPELSHSSTDRTHRERIRYLKKYLRRHLLGSISDVIRCSIGG
jgi:hypothetical protein